MADTKIKDLTENTNPDALDEVPVNTVTGGPLDRKVVVKKLMTECIMIPVSDETTTITTGTAKITFRMPYAFKVTKVKASLTTASSSGNPAFDINESGSTILSTTITIDANELTSETAATPPVISDSVLADDASITIDIDTAGTGAKGAKVYILGYKTAEPA